MSFKPVRPKLKGKHTKYIKISRQILTKSTSSKTKEKHPNTTNEMKASGRFAGKLWPRVTALEN
jgi:hypothetical protein